MKFFIKTFGCQQNKADSERIASYLKAQGMKPTGSYKKANYIVINTCMIRESAENRVYGLVNNLKKSKVQNPKSKIILTGCMTGMALKDKTGKFLKLLKKRLPEVDEFLAIEEIGFDTTPLNINKTSAFVPISNGCNNFCTYCVVPYTRGREKSLPYEDIIKECLKLKKKGYKNVTLLGQNVNSYGADLINVACDTSLLRGSAEYLRNPLLEEPLHSQHNLKQLKPIYVKHLGKYRIPTLFPHLLENIAKIGFEKVDFMSSNPWDFSDELIDVIALNKNITRTIHLPVQSGDNNVLKRMNRWYTRDEYLDLVTNLKLKIKNLKLTTDIIVGFCGETEKEFKNTVKLCKKVGFEKAYISMYSSRFGTVATKVFKDDVPHKIKKQRWLVLENLINKPHLIH